MMYKTMAALCSEIRTKHWTQGEHHVEFLNVKPGGKEKKYSLNAVIQAPSLRYFSQSTRNGEVFVKLVPERS
jgi:hypothetical protein